MSSKMSSPKRHHILTRPHDNNQGTFQTRSTDEQGKTKNRSEWRSMSPTINHLDCNATRPKWNFPLIYMRYTVLTGDDLFRYFFVTMVRLCTPPAKIISWVTRWELFYVMAESLLHRFDVMRPKMISPGIVYVMANPINYTQISGFPSVISWRAVDYMNFCDEPKIITPDGFFGVAGYMWVHVVALKQPNVELQIVRHCCGTSQELTIPNQYFEWEKVKSCGVIIWAAFGVLNVIIWAKLGFCFNSVCQKRYKIGVSTDMFKVRAQFFIVIIWAKLAFFWTPTWPR